MNEKTLLEAVVLAGELMLVSGAEIYRVEDTMNHMLKRSEYEQTETIVYGTGIFVTLSDPNKEPLTRVKRVAARCTSINRICLVNDVSRHFCEGKITVEEALRQLQEIQAPTTIQYDWLTQGLFTTAIRDTLNGDYAAGSARILEAIVVGLAVAFGVGAGLLVARSMEGGLL